VADAQADACISFWLFFMVFTFWGKLC